MQLFNPSTQTKPDMQTSSVSILNIFKRDDGVPRINIYLLRLLFALMFLFVTYDSWSHIFHHSGPWENANAAAWCMWGSFL